MLEMSVITLLCSRFTIRGKKRTTQHNGATKTIFRFRSMKRARDIRDQLEGLLERVEIEVSSNSHELDSMRKSIVAGFFPHTAKIQKNGSYRTVKHPQTVHIHSASGLSQVLPRWVVYHQLVLTSKEYMRQVTELKPEWLIEIAPHYY